MTDPDNQIESATITQGDQPHRRRNKKLTIIEFWAAILTITILVYSPILSNFFNGDDFVHLNWLHNAMQNPDLILRNFYSAWLDVPNARFYRPLISIFMLSDYGLWNRSGLGFHFTNLLTHLASALLLWLVLQRIFAESEDSENTENFQFWAFLAATLFAVYPLHPEAVSWITGRVDTIVTMFCLFNFWCYMKWRSTGKRPWFFASCAGLVCALLSKEMAVIQPALLVGYEFIMQPQEALSGSESLSAKGFFAVLVSKVQPTIKFWMILTGYFVLRYLSLGTLIGGYDNSILPAQGLSSFVKIWLHSALITVLPFNKNLAGPYEPLETVWLAWLAISFVLGVRSFSRNPGTRNKVLFLMFWLALSLVPLFKFFNISDDLQGSRLAYLPSAALCSLMSFGIAMIPTAAPALRILKLLLVASIILISALFLGINNSAWSTAGKESQAILLSLNDLYKTIPADTHVYIVGLPDNINGAYVSRNALEGMTKSPQLVLDATNCFALDNFDRVFPFGIARSSMSSPSLHPIIVTWNTDRSSFMHTQIPQPKGDQTVSWSNDKLKQIIVKDPHQPKSIELSWQPDGSLLISSSNRKTCPAVVFNLPQIPCWYAEYITMKIRCMDPQPEKGTAAASLIYTNDLQEKFDLAHRVEGPLFLSNEVQSVTFPLHSEVTWAMGGSCHAVKLQLPNGYKWLLDDIAIRPANVIMPMLSLAVAGNQNRLGYIELNRRAPSAHLEFNVESLPGAQTAALEVTGPDKFFELHNTTSTEAGSSVLKTAQGKRGSIDLNLTDFKADGIYEVRLRALDAAGKQIGLAGDHVVITVNH